MVKRRVCFVGAGSIAHVHAEAIAGIPGVGLHSIVEPNSETAASFAARWSVEHRFERLEDALSSGAIDCAHVLVPPPLHRCMTEKLLDHGIPVLTEKPLATTAADCEALARTAQQRGTVLAVNQNYVYNPAFARLLDLVERRRLGRLRSVQAVYSMPLRQLAARQFGHWMFDEPLNLLLEQAVHPLSLLCSLIGSVRSITALPGPAEEVAPGRRFVPEWHVTLQGEAITAQLDFCVGRSFPVQQVTAVCDDGVAVADLLSNRLTRQFRTRWLAAVDEFAAGAAIGAAHARQSYSNFVAYSLSQLRVRGRSDPFFASMKASIAAFHMALDRGTRPVCDGTFGASLVQVCEQIAAAARPEPSPAISAPARAASFETADVVLLGGTGFIGSSAVRVLSDAGMNVTVAARGVRNLPEVFSRRQVRVVRADVGNRVQLENAIDKTPIVVNLAHGGGGESFAEIERRMVGSARTVAEICRERAVKRLVHMSSIAALYLGEAARVVDGSVAPDPQPERRGDYARAKILAELALMETHRRDGLPLCILRPGLVVGEASSPFHSGLGLFNNEQHCLGWNAGTNALPFVLADDVAHAVLGALTAPGLDGRCYNLVGDVRLTAAQYIAALAEALQRPLRYHPQAVAKLFALEIGKWSIKAASGRAVPFPSLRDLKSRGLVSQFDCSDAKRDLQWTPVADRDVFLDRAIRVHARS